jgi:type VI secretion system secreted protein Hcp
MKRFLFGSFATLALGLALAASALAGSDMFLKIEGVEGEVTSAGNQGAVAVASWSFGASNPTSVGSSGMSAGRMAAPGAAEPKSGSGSVTLTKTYDKASPVLAKHCASGKHIASAQLTRCADGACKTYELQDVVISSVTIRNEGGAATEQLSLRYHQWRWLDAASTASTSALRESPTRQSLGGTSAPAPAKPK